MGYDAEGYGGSASRQCFAVCSRVARIFLWGFMNDDPDLLQEQPLIRMPEYDMVLFDPDATLAKRFAEGMDRPGANNCLSLTYPAPIPGSRPAAKELSSAAPPTTTRARPGLI